MPWQITFVNLCLLPVCLFFELLWFFLPLDVSLHSLSLFPQIQICWLVSNLVFIHIHSLLQLKWNVNYDLLWKQWNPDKNMQVLFSLRGSPSVGTGCLIASNQYWLWQPALIAKTERSFLTLQTAKTTLPRSSTLVLLSSEKFCCLAKNKIKV